MYSAMMVGYQLGISYSTNLDAILLKVAYSIYWFQSWTLKEKYQE